MEEGESMKGYKKWNMRCTESKQGKELSGKCSVADVKSLMVRAEADMQTTG